MSRGSQKFEFKVNGDEITVIQRITGSGRNGAARGRATFQRLPTGDWPMQAMTAHIENISVRSEHRGSGNSGS